MLQKFKPPNIPSSGELEVEFKDLWHFLLYILLKSMLKNFVNQNRNPKGIHSKSRIPWIPESADNFDFSAALGIVWEREIYQSEFLTTVNSAMCYE